MTNPSETEICQLLAVLDDAMQRCRDVLKKPRPEEIDLREALCFLKLAHADAEYGLNGVEKPEWHILRTSAVEMVSQLLKPLRAFNPELSTWERARDPGIPIQGGRLRSGGKRPFDPQQIREIYEQEKRRISGEIRPPPRPERGLSGRAAPLRAENNAPQEAGTSPGRVRHPTQDAGTPPGRPRHPPPDLPLGEGPPGGRFPLATTDGETSSDERDGRDSRGRRRLKRNQKKYGHQEDDLDFFRGAYQEEVMALQHLDLGDDFRYPSDRAFSLYFPEFDFVKAMRSNSLRKWDGTIHDYPNFRHTYYRMVFVQREHYMHKILALEQMVPEDIRKELFHGLHNTVSDLGQRLQRLEDRYGGQEKQLKQIINDLQKLGAKGKVPYPELRKAVEDVSAYLDRPSTLPGAGETLVVLLKKLVPKCFRTQFSDAMHQWNRPRTGNNFVAYIKRRLNYEMDEVDDFDRKEKTAERKESETKEKKEQPRTLGKMYRNTGAGTVASGESDLNLDSSSGKEGECLVAEGPTRTPRPPPKCRCCELGEHYLHSCRKLVFYSLYVKRASGIC